MCPCRTLTHTKLTTSMGKSFNSKERHALIALYQATGGKSWLYQKNWLSSQSLCHWEGVMCANGRVVGLELTNGNLRGALPPEIGELTDLQMLWLDHNQLSGLPSEIGQLAHLHDLALSHNLLSELPPEICCLTGLQALFLSNNRLRELPKNIDRLTHLKVLDLSGNQLPELPTRLDQLFRLEKLWLHGQLTAG